MAKVRINLDLAEREAQALNEMAAGDEMSKTQVIRQSLRLYQLVRHRTKQGERMCWKDSEGKDVVEMAFGCGFVGD